MEGGTNTTPGLKFYTSSDLADLEHKAKSGYFALKSKKWISENKDKIDFTPPAEKEADAPRAVPTPKPERKRRTSTVEKLRIMRERKEKCQEHRKEKAVEIMDFMTRLKANAFWSTRKAELKGMTHWYGGGESEYMDKFFLKFEPIRRYYENSPLDKIETSTELAGLRMIESSSEKPQKRLPGSRV